MISAISFGVLCFNGAKFLTLFSRRELEQYIPRGQFCFCGCQWFSRRDFPQEKSNTVSATVLRPAYVQKYLDICNIPKRNTFLEESVMNVAIATVHFLIRQTMPLPPSTLSEMFQNCVQFHGMQDKCYVNILSVTIHVHQRHHSWLSNGN